MQKVCLQTDVSLPYSKGSTVGLSSSSPLEVKGVLLAVTHPLFCGCWGLRTEQINLRDTDLFSSTSYRAWSLTWFAFMEFLSPLLNQQLLVDVRPCSLITSRLNRRAWVTPMLITSSPVFTDRLTDRRGESSQAPREMLVWYGEEQMWSLLPMCLCSEESVSNLHNEECFSALLRAAERSTCGSKL